MIMAMQRVTWRTGLRQWPPGNDHDGNRHVGFVACACVCMRVCQPSPAGRWSAYVGRPVCVCVMMMMVMLVKMMMVIQIISQEASRRETQDYKGY